MPSWEVGEGLKVFIHDRGHTAYSRGHNPFPCSRPNGPVWISGEGEFQVIKGDFEISYNPHDGRVVVHQGNTIVPWDTYVSTFV